MRYLFELSKEHKTVPTEEIISCLLGENIDFKIVESNHSILLIDSNEDVKMKQSFKRLSYTYFINKFLFSCKPDLKILKKNSIEKKFEFTGSIAIKCKNRSKKIDSEKIIKTLAGVFTEGKKVNLDDPDNEIRALITDSKIYVGLKLYKVDRTQFEKRKAQFRPFFSPISLHPKIARVLVNLSGVRKKDTLLDPFCGTGGILIEGGLIGLELLGSDIEEKMIEGCRENLDFYNIKDYKIFLSDIGSIDKYIDKVDSVVTDLPYGKSTTTKGEDMSILYDRSFKMIANVLKDNKKAVIGLSDKRYISTAKKYLKLIKIHEFRAHRSLTRFFVVFKKEP